MTIDKIVDVKYFILSFISMPAFPLWRIVGREKLETPHGQQQSLMVLLIQDGTMQGCRYSHSTWSLDNLWATFLWV